MLARAPLGPTARSRDSTAALVNANMCSYGSWTISPRSRPGKRFGARRPGDGDRAVQGRRPRARTADPHRTGAAVAGPGGHAAPRGVRPLGAPLACALVERDARGDDRAGRRDNRRAGGPTRGASIRGGDPGGASLRGGGAEA